MRRAMFDKFGRVSPNVKPAVLRFFYRDLTGDSPSAHDTPESVIDERVREIISMEPEDPNTVVDLREVRSDVNGFLYTATTQARCYAPWYKSVIQLGFGLYGIHNLVPVALGRVYPVETSTSLYNLYLHHFLSRLETAPSVLRASEASEVFT